MGLSLSDWADRELLAFVADCADEDGWVSTDALADELQATPQSVGGRLSWMRRFDLIETEKRGSARYWCLTDAGEAYANGSLSKNVTDILRRNRQSGLLARELVKRAAHGEDAEYHIMRREWQRGIRR